MFHYTRYKIEPAYSMHAKCISSGLQKTLPNTHSEKEEKIYARSYFPQLAKSLPIRFPRRVTNFHRLDCAHTGRTQKQHPAFTECKKYNKFYYDIFLSAFTLLFFPKKIFMVTVQSRLQSSLIRQKIMSEHNPQYLPVTFFLFIILSAVALFVS